MLFRSGRPTINIDADDAELLAEISARFPKLTAKFWEWWTRDKVIFDIRDMLREILMPLEFSETELKSLTIVKFQRDQFRVEITLDSDNDGPYITLFVSSVLSEKGYPIRQSIMQFSYREYDAKKRRVILASTKEWLASIGL